MPLQKKLQLSATLPIHYDPDVDEILELLLPYPALYEQKLAENFIDTVIYDNEISKNVSFYRITNAVVQDCMLTFSLPFDIAKVSVADICEYFIHLLEMEYHVHFLCDTFFVESYTSYQSEHIEHSPLIYGYDRQRRVFFARDYFDFQALSEKEVAFQDIQSSYVNGEFVVCPGEHALLNPNVLYCAKVINQEARAPNLPLIQQHLENFVGNFSYTNSEGLHYGICFFDFLVNRYQMNPSQISMKHCHFIYAHMQFMLFRTEVLQKYRPDNIQQYEMVIGSLKELLQHVRHLEMSILKSQLTATALKLDYAKELIGIKTQYAEIIQSIIRAF